MREEFVQALIRLYSSAEEPVYLFDREWNCLWHSADAAQPQELAALLRTAGGAPVRVMQGEVSYDCSCLEDPENGVRVARLSRTMQQDAQAVRYVMHAVTASCQMIRESVEEYGADGADQLEAIMGNVYRLYRMSYLQEALSAMSGPPEAGKSFGLCQNLRNLWQRIRNVLRHCADAAEDALSLPADGEVFLAGRPEDFDMAVLSAVTLLCSAGEEQAYWHSLALSVDVQEQEAVITITARKMPQERDTRLHTPEGFGPLTQEQGLLAQYCTRMGGSYMLSDNGQTHTCRMTLPLTAHGRTIGFSSGGIRTLEPIFNPYEVVLARLDYRSFL